MIKMVADEHKSAGKMAGAGLGLEITELRLGLPGSRTPTPANKNQKKRVFSETMISTEETDGDGHRRCQKKKKNEVVGWPPVCSYRRRSSFKERDESESPKMYVKVSMDGAPFLRKLDLAIHGGYSDLCAAAEELFGCSIGCSDYVFIYEDGDGDWMLAGDVPWKMFTESCRRLRIMKRSSELAKGFEIHQMAQSSGSTKDH